MAVLTERSQWQMHQQTQGPDSHRAVGGANVASGWPLDDAVWNNYRLVLKQHFADESHR